MTTEHQETLHMPVLALRDVVVYPHMVIPLFVGRAKSIKCLDAAMDNDLDVPFSCKGAVCCTCRAKVLEGKVHMKANYALTEEEVAEGFILTCQAHPLTAKVVVDYDV